MLHSQAIEINYLDEINYWKSDFFYKKVKEVETDYQQFDVERNGREAIQKIRKQTYTKQIFNRFGKLISQLDQTTFFNFSKNRKTYSSTIYTYDENQRLVKERTYTDLDSILLKPKDTAAYVSKSYKYDGKGILLRCEEYNKTKNLIKTTSISIDSIQKTMTLLTRGNSNDYSNYLKTDYKFDTAAHLIEQTFYKGNKPNGRNSITYNANGQKEKEHYQAFDSHYESVEQYQYNKNGLLELQKRNSNIDPGDSLYYTYTLDKNKNWLTKEIKNEEGITVESFTRKIVYYK